MGNKIIHGAFVFALLIGLSLGMGIPARALGATATPTVPPVAGTPTPNPTQQASLISSDANVVSFSQLKQTNVQLTGPYDIFRFSFALPADWKVTPGAQLILSLSTFINTVAAGSTTPGSLTGGTLSVILNNNTLGIIPLNAIGDVEQKMDIAPSDFVSVNADGSMSLSFILDSGATCNSNNNVSLLIRPTSYLMVSHNSIEPDTSLVQFPKPLYQGSFNPDSALIVLPEHPSSAELQAALTVAAGLGTLTANNLQLDMTTMGAFRPSDPSSPSTTDHIIFVGKPDSLTILNTLHLPLPDKGGTFQTTGGGPDDGVIQMITSPWSPTHVALVVSGNSDQGIIKAAQAVSTGILRPNSSPNLSIVTDINSTTIVPSQSIDQNLTELGLTGGLFSGRGDFSNAFRFTIPPGRTLAQNAYFDLDFSNSSLINYDRSTIIVSVNDRPIGSVRMSDATAGQAMNQTRITIPAAAVVPGANQLQIRVSIVPLDNCTPLSSRGLWVSIWPQSTLHLPLDVTSVSPVAITNLAIYPAPFIYDSALSNTAFVLAHDDLDSWRGAMRIAAALGQRANGTVNELSVFYSEELSPSLRTKYNLLVIGEPTQTPFVNDINQFLPAPFSNGSNLATENNFQVTYRIPPDSPMGYVEMIPSPWNPNNIILAALGNNVQGVDSAVSALTDPILQTRLSGNIAVINGSQIVSTDTRVVNVTTGNSPAVTSNPNATPVVGNISSPAPAQSNGWIFPVMLIAIIMIIVIIIIIVAGNRSRNRVRVPRKDE